MLHSGVPRAKLQVGQPNDQYEREADQVAENVMRAADGKSTGIHTGHKAVQRQCTDCAGERAPGSGKALSSALRAYFEPRFGADLGGVRLHTDAQAAASAQALHARAYTWGQDVVFGPGEYKPDTSSGRRLLAHELAHTLQPDAGRRIRRQCAGTLASTAVPQGESRLHASAWVDLGRVPVTGNITATIASNFDVLIHVPRGLQRAIGGGGWLGNALGGAVVDVDISGQIGNSSGAGSNPSQLCLFVTFHEEPAGSNAWIADFRLLRGGHMSVPLQVNVGTGTSAPALANSPVATLGPVGIGAPTGAARVDMQLVEDAAASFGPVRIPRTGSLADIWSSIRDQLRGLLALRIQGIALREIGRLRGSLSVPLLVGEGEQVTPLPLEVLGDLRLATEVSQESGRVTVRLSSNTSATALGGLLALELSGRGSVSGPIPASIRLSDLNTEFFRNLLSSGEGEGALRGRLSLAGLPSRSDANFQLHAGRLTGSASLVSVAGVGRGTFQYSLDQGFSARGGLLGLTVLVIAAGGRKTRV